MSGAGAFGLMDLDLSDLSSDEEELYTEATAGVSDFRSSKKRAAVHAPIMDTILEGFEEDSLTERQI